MSLPRYQLSRRTDKGWQAMCTFDTLEDAAEALHPWSGKPLAEKECPRGTVLIGLLFAAVVGFALAAVLIQKGTM